MGLTTKTRGKKVSYYWTEHEYKKVVIGSWKLVVVSTLRDWCVQRLLGSKELKRRLSVHGKPI